MWNALGKFLFPRLIKWAFRLGAKAFEDEVGMETHGRQSWEYTINHVYEPLHAAAVRTATGLDNGAVAFARGYLRVDVHEREQAAKDRETRGNHPGV